MKKKNPILFVGYGGGHLNMLLPVAHELYSSGIEVLILGLTLAERQAEASGLPFKRLEDFVTSDDRNALRKGKQLARQLDPHPSINRYQTEVYLGLGYFELEQQVGKKEASRLYAKFGRASFLQLSLAHRIIKRVKPIAVVATTSPRLEHAVLLEAKKRAIPTFCLIDFCNSSQLVERLSNPNLADDMFVSFETIAETLRKKGKNLNQIHVFGNPAFDDLLTSTALLSEKTIKRNLFGDSDVSVITIALSAHPDFKEYEDAIIDAILEKYGADQNIQVILKAHPGLPFTRRSPEKLPRNCRIIGKELSNAELLTCSHCLIHLNSTLGIEAHMAGCWSIQANLFNFEKYFSHASEGIGQEAKTVSDILDILKEALNKKKPNPAIQRPAAALIADKIRSRLIDT